MGAEKKKFLFVSPLGLEWNTLQNMVIKWNEVFKAINLGGFGVENALAGG